MELVARAENGRNTYARRVPEDTILYDVVSDQLTTFFAHAESSGRTVPAFVERELTRYLECGILAYGFVRVRCAACSRRCALGRDASTGPLATNPAA